jgi:hypothetical protein
MEKEKEQSRFIIQRFDNYINGANTKGNFLLAFNTFICGGIIANYKNIMALIELPVNNYLINYCLVALFTASIITTVLIIRAVYPFLSSGNSSKNKYHSHIFFNSVAEFGSGDEYYASFTKMTDKAVEEDLAKQAYQLARGLKNKFHFLEWACAVSIVNYFY